MGEAWGVRAVARAVLVVLGTWAALAVALLLPAAVLPVGWQYYVYSPASLGLWLLTVLIGPLFACRAARRWIIPERYAARYAFQPAARARR